MAALTQSYINTQIPGVTPPEIKDSLWTVWQKSRDLGGPDSEFVNLETNEHVMSSVIFEQADEFARGFLSLDCLTAGEDCIAMIGCINMQSLPIWCGCLSIGVASAHPNIFLPRETTLERTLSVAKPKIVIVGEGSDGEILPALASHFDKEKTTPQSTSLPWVQHIYYDGPNPDILRQYSFMKPINDLKESGRTISDTILQQARQAVKPEYPAHLIFSSGSTGFPKCIQYSQGHVGIMTSTKFPLATTCMSSSFNNDVMAAFLRAAVALNGGHPKLVITPDCSKNLSDERYSQICAEAIVNEKVATIIIQASKLELICDYMGEHYPDVKPLLSTYLGGQRYSSTFREKVQSIMGGKILTLYGMSEVVPVAYTAAGDDPGEEEDRLTASMTILPFTEVRLVDDEGKIVDIGEEGELEVKSVLFTFLGYRGEPEKTKQIYTHDGFYKSGDIAVMDTKGKIQIRGRTTDRLRFKVDRKVVWPSPIEEALISHPNIREIKVTSCAINDTVGDEIVYCIKLEKGAEEFNEDELISCCKEKGLSEIQFPYRVLYFDTIPLTVNERKFDTKKLKELVQQRVELNPEEGRYHIKHNY